MLYTVDAYVKGQSMKSKKVEATNPVEAAKKSMLADYGFSHFVVVGKTTVRLTPKYKKITNPPVFYRVKRRAILVMFGQYPEFFVFKNKEHRDKVFEEITCTISTSAEFAKTEAEPTDTTVSSEETKDTKSSSTFPKIWSGYATPAICRARRIPYSIVANSGCAKSEDMV